ncbi:protein-tyrosine phosphatase [Spinactinospora alkalitolerans]|uniref:Protein-tyrosine phosphatase n=1 Tax=Spinactinospora alkalitolerans TaxID=687207 RepID=A0A852TT09_9ACTN|nr:protein-tyrosine phosphatase [Spinactinospora alkalitolerans]
MTNDAPMLTTAPNFRDLGGAAANGGERVRRGLLFRADALSRLDEADLAVLEGMELRQLIDLRTVFERDRAADRVPRGAEYVVLDVQRDHRTGGDLAAVFADPERANALLADNGAERFMHEVNRMLVGTEDACAGYRELVERAAHGPLPLVFHCSAGKDRTGWGAVVILSLLGVPREAIIADYLASNGRLGAVIDWMMGMVRTQGIDADQVKPMLEVRTEYLETAFAEVDRVHGSFDGYVAGGLRLKPETVSALRERLLT